METSRPILLAAVALTALVGCEHELVDHGFDVTSGTVQIPAPPSPAAASHAFVPFTPPAAGDVSLSIDWEPRGSRVSFSVSAGPCSTSPCPAEIDMGPFTDGARNQPISGTSFLSARLYTLRIDNWGSSAVVASYRVRVVPR